MRYIDADAAVEEARLAYCKECNSYNGVMCRACAFDDAMSFIEDFPESDVAPKSEVAREIFEDLEMYVEEHDGCSVNLSRCEFAELKKKYTNN